MKIERIGVIGAGQMGSGIAHVAALAGKSVILVDVSAPLAERGSDDHGARLRRSAR